MQYVICSLVIDDKGINRALRSVWFCSSTLDDKNLGRTTLSLIDKAWKSAFLEYIIKA